MGKGRVPSLALTPSYDLVLCPGLYPGVPGIRGQRPQSEQGHTQRVPLPPHTDVPKEVTLLGALSSEPWSPHVTHS